MSATFTEEGLKAILNFLPRKSTPVLPELLYLGVFTTNTTPLLTPTTVPNRTTRLSLPGTAIGEPTVGIGGYARVAVPNEAWDEIEAVGSTAFRTIATEQTFPLSTGPWDKQTVLGYFIADSPTPGLGIAYYYSNFEDGIPIVVNSPNISVIVQPFWEIHF